MINIFYKKTYDIAISQGFEKIQKLNLQNIIFPHSSAFPRLAFIRLLLSFNTIFIWIFFLVVNNFKTFAKLLKWLQLLNSHKLLDARSLNAIRESQIKWLHLMLTKVLSKVSELLRKSSYSVRIRRIKEQKNSK